MSELEAKRARVAELRQLLRQKSIELQDAQKVVAEIKRAAGRSDSARLAAAQARVDEAQLAKQAADTELRTAVSGLGHLIEITLTPTTEEEIARLEANRPLVLLPVRIETRFVGTDLLVRIYPDDIFADTHEPELTNVELEDGKRFWEM